MVRIRSFSALTLLALASACSRREAPVPVASPPLPVRTVAATQRPLERVLTVTGTLLAQEQTPLSARVAGRVSQLPVDLGSRVRTGEVVAELERREYELRVEQSQGLLGQARARLGLPLAGTNDAIVLAEVGLVREASAVLNQARAERDRVAELSRQGIASPVEREAAESSLSVAQSRYDDALSEVRTRSAQLQQRRAEYELAAKQLEDTRITAPFDGVIAERYASRGQFLEVGAPVFKLVQADPLRLRVEVPERDAFRVAVGQPVRVRLTGDPHVYPGTVRRLSPGLVELSRMLVVEAEVPAAGALRPGAFARVELVVETNRPALTLPADTLITFAGLEKVMVRVDGKAVERRITTGDRGDGWIEVSSGLQSGDAVIRAPGGLVAGRAVTEAAPTASGGPQP
jgi:RND family efflux transporter MFP subunit